VKFSQIIFVGFGVIFVVVFRKRDVGCYFLFYDREKEKTIKYQELNQIFTN